MARFHRGGSTVTVDAVRLPVMIHFGSWIPSLVPDACMWNDRGVLSCSLVWLSDKGNGTRKSAVFGSGFGSVRNVWHFPALVGGSLIGWNES